MYVGGTVPYDFCFTSLLSKFNAPNFDKYHIKTKMRGRPIVSSTEIKLTAVLL